MITISLPWWILAVPLGWLVWGFGFSLACKILEDWLLGRPSAHSTGVDWVVCSVAWPIIPYFVWSALRDHKLATVKRLLREAGATDCGCDACTSLSNVLGSHQNAYRAPQQGNVLTP